VCRWRGGGGVEAPQVAGGMSVPAPPGRALEAYMVGGGGGAAAPVAPGAKARSEGSRARLYAREHHAELRSNRRICGSARITVEAW